MENLTALIKLLLVLLPLRDAWSAFPGALRPWITTSLVATFVAAYLVVRRIVRPRIPRGECI